MNIITKTKTHYDEPFLYEIDANVISCKEDKGEYLVELDETIFYAESGGQPTDRGTIDGHEVVDVYVYDGRVFHVLNEPVQGTVHLHLDEKYRLLNVQRQSCQHMIGSIFLRKLNLPAPSARVYEDGTCDLDIECDSLTADQIKFVEDTANEYIRNDVEFKINYVDWDKAKSVIENTYGSSDSYTDLPNYRDIEIVGLDEELCGCIHVPSARYIQGVKIQSTEKSGEYTKVILSVGEHLLNNFEKNYNLLHKVSVNLGTKPEDALSAIEGLRDQNKEALKEKDAYRELYLESIIEAKARELASMDDSEPRLIVVDNQDLPLEDIKYLIVNYVKNHKVICVGIKEDNGKLSLVISKSKDTNNFSARDAFQKLQKEYHLGGGGSPLVAQGGGKAFEGYNEKIVEAVKSCIE